MTISWDPTLALGIPDLDRQHKEFFARVDSLVHAIRSGFSRDEVGRTLAFLGSYASTHFAAEEALMRAVGFPGLAEHRSEHAGFVRDMEALEAEHQRDGASPSLILRVNVQLSGWLRDHICRTDRELAAFLRQRQKPPG
jgi:hemerythrin